MLILSRRVGESVVIGENISVTVLRVKGNQIRLGVDAPKSVPVRRGEDPERIKSDSVVTTDEACSEPAVTEDRLSLPVD